jgi:hypothetical protein
LLRLVTACPELLDWSMALFDLTCHFKIGPYSIRLNTFLVEVYHKPSHTDDTTLEGVGKQVVARLFLWQRFNRIPER